MNLKLLFKRGALIAAGNWPIVAVQFIAETTFQALLAVPIVGAAVLAASLVGRDLADLLGGSLREMFGRIADTLTSEPVALAAFITACALVVLGGSVLTFLVKGGTVEVLATAGRSVRAIETEPVTLHLVGSASRFTLERFMSGCRRLSRRYVSLGLLLMVAYAVSGLAYLAFVVYGYRAAGDRVPVLGWTFVAGVAAILLVIWITIVNLIYLLLQIAIAVQNTGVLGAVPIVARFVRAEFRPLARVFVVELALVVGATWASALAWSGVGLIAFVPLVGVAVLPLQLAALVLRGLVFQYIGLSALGAYLTLFAGHASHLEAPKASALTSSPIGHPA